MQKKSVSSLSSWHLPPSPALLVCGTSAPLCCSTHIPNTHVHTAAVFFPTTLILWLNNSRTLICFLLFLLFFFFWLFPSRLLIKGLVGVKAVGFSFLSWGVLRPLFFLLTPDSRISPEYPLLHLQGLSFLLFSLSRPKWGRGGGGGWGCAKQKLAASSWTWAFCTGASPAVPPTRLPLSGSLLKMDPKFGRGPAECSMPHWMIIL